MSQAPAAKKLVAPGMNIYTVLTIVATVALAVGVGFIMQYSKKLTGNSNPYYVEQKNADQKTGLPTGG